MSSATLGESPSLSLPPGAGKGSTRFDEIPPKGKGGRPRREVAKARICFNVFASVERVHRSGALGHPSFWECLDTERKEKDSLARIAAAIGVDASEVSVGGAEVVHTSGEFVEERREDKTSSERMYDATEEKYLRGGRLVVNRYIVRADVVECCQLVERAVRVTKCPGWLMEAMLETWPRFGRFAGVAEDRGRTDPWVEYVSRGEVQIEMGNLRSAVICRNLARFFEQMELGFLEELDVLARARWGRVESERT